MKNECVELNELVSAYADGEISGADLERVEKHVADCAECREFVAACRRIDDAVRADLVPPPVEDRRWDAMLVQLKAAGGQRPAGRKWRFHPARVIAFASTMAAACLLGLAFVMLPREPEKPVEYGLEIEAGAEPTDYQVVMIAAPEGGLSMMVIVDIDDQEEDTEVEKPGGKPDEKEAGGKPESGEK